MTEPLFRTEDLHKNFGGVRATNGVSLAVSEGDFHAIIGPNGAGKSTLFNLMTGFVRPDAGQVLFSGRRIDTLPPRRLYRFGISRTFQITSIFTELTLRENLELALLSRRGRLLSVVKPYVKELDGEIAELLSTVALSGDLHLPAKHLSHGDQKKLELAGGACQQATSLAARRADGGHGLQ